MFRVHILVLRVAWFQCSPLMTKVAISYHQINNEFLDLQPTRSTCYSSIPVTIQIFLENNLSYGHIYGRVFVIPHNLCDILG